MARTITGMKTISENMENTARVITGLGRRSQEIGKILEVIEEIADQTNLLALNAAIEAARAGEAGRGFAVVADEVRKLAERSVEATKEIGEVIRQVQAETTDAVEAAKAGAAETKEGIALADKAGLALRSIIESVSRSSQLMGQIASATAKQSQASADVLQTVANMNAATSQVTTAVREQAEGSKQIRAAMENINKIMTQAAYSTKEQAAGGRQVRVAVENMNKIASQVNIATKEQAEGSRQIVTAVENMNRMTQQVSLRHRGAEAGRGAGGEGHGEHLGDRPRQPGHGGGDVQGHHQPRPAGREPGQAHLRLPRAMIAPVIDIQAALLTLRTGEESRRRRVVDELGASRRPEAIAPLLMAVADESWPVRQAAAEHLAAFDPPTILPALEAALRDDEDAGARNAAMEIYVKLGGAAVAPLLALLGDADEEVRNFAAVMLGALRDRRAVGPLMAALADPDLNVRHAAAASLGQIGDPRGGAAAHGRAALGGLAAVPRDHRPGRDRRPAGGARAPGAAWTTSCCARPAMEALGRLAGREALPHLVPHLYDADGALRNIAIQAVVAIEQRATAGGESLDPEVQAALRREDLVDHLIATLRDDEPQNRRTAAITLGWLKEPRAERPLIDLLAEPALQEYVTHALVSIGLRDEAAYRYGLSHPDDTVRQAAGPLRLLDRARPRPRAGGPARRGPLARGAGGGGRGHRPPGRR